MGTPQHEALVAGWMRRIAEIGLGAALPELAHPDIELINPNSVSDFGGLVARFQEMEIAFPDADVMVNQVVSEGDTLVLVVDVRGTHLGPMRNIPPTGKSVDFSIAFVMKIRDGKVVRLRTYPEFFSVMVQLGMIPELGVTPLQFPPGGRSG